MSMTMKTIVRISSRVVLAGLAVFWFVGYNWFNFSYDNTVVAFLFIISLTCLGIWRENDADV